MCPSHLAIGANISLCLVQYQGFKTQFIYPNKPTFAEQHTTKLFYSGNNYMKWDDNWKENYREFNISKMCLAAP